VRCCSKNELVFNQNSEFNCLERIPAGKKHYRTLAKYQSFNIPRLFNASGEWECFHPDHFVSDRISKGSRQ